MSLGELREARINLREAEEARERALDATEQANRRFADAESGWHREARDLRAALNEALGAAGKDENNASCGTDVKFSKESTTRSGLQPSSPQRPRAAVTGGPVTQNEAPQTSASGASDATSRDLAEELLQKLTDETKQRRSTRQALSDKVTLFGA